MFADDNEPKKKVPHQLNQDVSDLSIDDLNEVIEELEAEILRLKAEVKSKAASKSAADTFFKS